MHPADRVCTCFGKSLRRAGFRQPASDTGVTVLVLSAGTLGIPGAGVICLSVLLQQLGVPTEGVGMVMGIGPILGMFLCMVNCLGDVVASTIVARRCGEMNMDVYSK